MYEENIGWEQNINDANIQKFAVIYFWLITHYLYKRMKTNWPGKKQVCVWGDVYQALVLKLHLILIPS